MIELHNMDCMDYLKTCPDNAFDLCVTSPPYNMNLRVNAKGDGYCSRQLVKEISSKYHGYDDNLPMNEYEEFICNMASHLIRTSRLTFLNIQMITGNKPALFKFMGRFADNIKELIVWDKKNGQPSIGNGVMNSCFELIIVLSSNAITRSFSPSYFERGKLDNIIRLSSSKSNDNNHKATFPMGLVDSLLRNFSCAGQKIIDPFMGTGTTAISSYYAGLDFVGIELDEDYFKAAKARIEQETKQMDMF